MTSQSKTELVISAVDKATATLNLIGARMDALVKPAVDVQKAFGRIYNASGLGKAASAVSGLGRAVAGAAASSVGIAGVYAGAVTQIVRFGMSAADAADQVGDLAEKYQVMASTLQVYGALVEEDGGNMEDAAAAIGKLKKAMNEATHGGKEQAAAFAGVGLSVAQLKGMKAEEVMERMAGAFAGSENDLAKQAVLLELMGKNGQVMMGTFNRGADGIREKYAQMRADGRLFSEEQLSQADKFDKTWQRLKGTFTGLKNTLGLRLADKLTPMLEGLQKWAVEHSPQIIAVFDKFLAKLPKIVDVGTQMFEGLWDVLKSLGKTFLWLSNSIGPTATVLLGLGVMMAPTVVAIGSVVWAVGGLVYKIGTLTGALPAVSTAIKAVWTVMKANPMGLLVAAIAGLSYLIYENWDGIVDYVGNAWDRIKSVFSVNFFDGIIQVWLESWQAMGNGILGIIKSVLPEKWMPDILKNFNFTFATDRANNLTAAQAAKNKTEVGGTLKIQIDGAPAKVTEVSKASNAMDIDVTAGLYMAGA